MRDVVASFITTTVVIFAFVFLFLLSGVIGCARESPLVVGPLPPRPPACIVVLGPPPVPPISFRELAAECRHPDGSQMRPDEWCMSAEEVRTLRTFTAQAHLYAVTAYRACQLSEPGDEEIVRVLP